MVNQKDHSLKIKEAMPSEMIEESRDALDVIKKDTSKGTIWQKISIYTMRRK